MNNKEKSLGNFGVYKSIFNGIGDYKGFKAKDENGKIYRVGSVEIDSNEGVVLRIYEDEKKEEKS